MDEKLNELTDLKGKLQEMVKGMVREKIRESARETSAGKILALIETAEKEYGRLKKLFEKCVLEPKTSKQVIIVHGCTGADEKSMNPRTRTYNRHWMPWLKKELTTKGIDAETPLMPNPWAPVYEKYKEELEKYAVGENTILVGHSCGCAFLVRWLGESKTKINKLILVAPWKIPYGSNPVISRFYEYPIDEKIKFRVKEVVMFTSDDEEEDGKKSLKIFHDALGGKILDLKGHGHYTFGDMGTEEFPELLEVIMR